MIALPDSTPDVAARNELFTVDPGDHIAPLNLSLRGRAFEDSCTWI